MEHDFDASTGEHAAPHTHTHTTRWQQYKRIEYVMKFYGKWLAPHTASHIHALLRFLPDKKGVSVPLLIPLRNAMHWKCTCLCAGGTNAKAMKGNTAHGICAKNRPKTSNFIGFLARWNGRSVIKNQPHSFRQVANNGARMEASRARACWRASIICFLVLCWFFSCRNTFFFFHSSFTTYGSGQLQNATLKIDSSSPGICRHFFWPRVRSRAYAVFHFVAIIHDG